MLHKIEDKKRRYIEEDGSYEFFALFYTHPHLRHAVSVLIKFL